MDEFTKPKSLNHPPINADYIHAASKTYREGVSSLVLVLYTGGTIGMARDHSGSYKPKTNFLAQEVRNHPMLHDSRFAETYLGKPCMDDSPVLVMPPDHSGRRVFYTICEYYKLLDSSNCTFDNWVTIAKNIESHYCDFDGFVVLHGTDTMSYAASMLAFILENLSKPVILTGSQISLVDIRSDGRENIVSALLLAGGGYAIPEVTVYFHNKLMRGCRTVKCSSEHFDAFASPNYPPLVDMSIDITMNVDKIRCMPAETGLHVQELLSRQVAILRLFPSIRTATVKHFLEDAHLKGVVLQSYGAGNVPSARTDIMNLFKQAIEKGVLIVNTTQCFRGGVKAIYETGAALHECGVIPAFDMTPEAALAKLAYLIARHDDFQARKEAFLTNLRGEVTIPVSFSLHACEDQHPGRNISSCSNDEQEETARVLHTLGHLVAGAPTNRVSIMAGVVLAASVNAFAACNNVSALTKLSQYIGNQFDEWTDHTGHSALHVAAKHGCLETIAYLIENGASLAARDAQGCTPLLFAVRNHADSHLTTDLIQLLLTEKQSSVEAIYQTALEAVSRGDVIQLRLLLISGACLNQMNVEQQHSLVRAAIAHGHWETLKFLLGPLAPSLSSRPVDVHLVMRDLASQEAGYGAGIGLPSRELVDQACKHFLEQAALFCG